MAIPHERNLILKSIRLLRKLSVKSLVGQGGLLGLVAIAVTFNVSAQRSIPLPPPPAIIWPDEHTSEPARWTQEDVTQEQKFDTARKEAVAAQHIAVEHCKSLQKMDQSLCLAQTKIEFEQEIRDLKAKFGAAP